MKLWLRWFPLVWHIPLCRGSMTGDGETFFVLRCFNQLTSLVWLSVWLQKCLCCLHAGDHAGSREREGDAILLEVLT